MSVMVRKGMTPVIVFMLVDFWAAGGLAAPARPVASPRGGAHESIVAKPSGSGSVPLRVRRSCGDR